MEEKITKPIVKPENPVKVLTGVVVTALVLGILTGYILSTKGGNAKISPLGTGTAKNPTQDSKTFRDFAQGIIKPKPQNAKSQTEEGGTHLLIRENAVPVTLTSSVVDLSKYEGKKVKVFGETQAVPGTEWFMDVGKVEEEK